MLSSTIPISSSVSPYSRAAIDQPVRPLLKWPQFANRLPGPGPWPVLPAGRIDGQFLAVLLEYSQKALVIMLVVALQPAQEAFDLLASFCLFISSILSARWARKSCTTSDFSFSAMKLPASSLGRQASAWARSSLNLPSR